MIQLILTLILVLALCIGGYYAVIHIIKLWTGCSIDEAVTKFHNLVNGKAQYTFSNDNGFKQAVAETVKAVIGDKRFNQLIKLNSTGINPTVFFIDDKCVLPYVAVSVYYADENEKQVLENLLTELVRRYLKIYGYCEQVLVDWKVRKDLQMPVLVIRYAQNQEERRILGIRLGEIRNNIVAHNTDIKDDTDDKDLDDDDSDER